MPGRQVSAGVSSTAHFASRMAPQTLTPREHQPKLAQFPPTSTTAVKVEHKYFGNLCWGYNDDDDLQRNSIVLLHTQTNTPRVPHSVFGHIGHIVQRQTLRVDQQAGDLNAAKSYEPTC